MYQKFAIKLLYSRIAFFVIQLKSCLQQKNLIHSNWKLTNKESVIPFSSAICYSIHNSQDHQSMLELLISNDSQLISKRWTIVYSAQRLWYYHHVIRYPQRVQQSVTLKKTQSRNKLAQNIWIPIVSRAQYNQFWHWFQRGINLILLQIFLVLWILIL